MTLGWRVDQFKAAYPKVPASWPWLTREQGRDVLYAVWVIGNNYRNKTQFYGSYPPSFLPRVLALFPDAGGNVLHAFSGALPAGDYSRLDLVDHDGVPDLRFHQGTVYDAGVIFIGRDPFRLIVADPPYSKVDATKYGTPMIDRRRALAALADVTQPGGHLAWLDTVWPMHSKRQWVTVGRILVQRSTNHRVRLLSIFERVAC